MWFLTIFWNLSSEPWVWWRDPPQASEETQGKIPQGGLWKGFWNCGLGRLPVRRLAQSHQLLLELDFRTYHPALGVPVGGWVDSPWWLCWWGEWVAPCCSWPLPWCGECCEGTDPCTRQTGPGGQCRAEAGGKFYTQTGILNDFTSFVLLSCFLRISEATVRVSE